MNLQTNPDYWDCKCRTDYIKPRRQEYCGKCHTARIGQPDSRQNEVEKMKMQTRFDQSKVNA